MDRATKIYAYFLLVLALGSAIWLLYEDPTVASLNAALARDPEIAAYPYRFHVERLEGRTAVMGTPRSPEVPVRRIIGILHPDVSGRSPDSQAFQQAQKELAAVQGKARKIVLAQPEVDTVRWELDERWLQRHGVQVQSMLR